VYRLCTSWPGLLTAVSWYLAQLTQPSSSGPWTPRSCIQTYRDTAMREVTQNIYISLFLFNKKPRKTKQLKIVHLNSGVLLGCVRMIFRRMLKTTLITGIATFLRYPVPLISGQMIYWHYFYLTNRSSVECPKCTFISICIMVNKMEKFSTFVLAIPVQKPGQK
jgi:hypothetical protein